MEVREGLRLGLGEGLGLGLGLGVRVRLGREALSPICHTVTHGIEEGTGTSGSIKTITLAIIKKRIK